MLYNQKHLFSIEEGIHYLNCATMSPNLKSVEKAGILGIVQKSNPQQITQEHFFEVIEQPKKLFARLIGASEAERIALIPSVSYGMAIVAKNLYQKPGLKSGQEILLVHEEFPSDVYAWEEICREKKLKVKIVQPPNTLENRGEKWNHNLLEAIGEQTCLVVIPPLHWADGTRFDLKTISAKAKEFGAWVVVDGTQGVGAMPFHLSEIQADALICAAYKWLLGPYSTGLAWYGPAFDNGSPLEQNWINRMGSEEFSRLVEYRTDYRPKAGRYSMGEQSNFILMPMLEASLTQILQWGTENIQEYCKNLMAGPISNLKKQGFWVEEEDWRGHHLFGIRLPKNIDMAKVKRKLADRKIYVSVRGNALRIAPHLYNDQNDAEALVGTLLELITLPKGTQFYLSI